MPSSAGYYPPGQQQQQQQQQQSVIQKWALVRPDALQDLLARQRGTSSVHHGGGTNQEDKDCHHLPIVAAGLGGPLCPRQTATRPPRGGPSGTSAAQLQSPGWEAPPAWRRLGSAANGEKTATTGPPSGTRLDPSPEQPQGISHAHALWHQSRASCRGHSGRLPRIGALPGPLPTMPATSPERDQGGGLRWAPRMWPEGPEVDSH